MEIPIPILVQYLCQYAQKKMILLRASLHCDWLDLILLFLVFYYLITQF